MKKQTKKSTYKFNRLSRLNKLVLLAVMVIVGAIGVKYLFLSHAATGRINVNAPVVGIQYGGSTSEYWVATTDGGVFSMGGAHFYGSAGSLHLAQPIVSFARRPQTDGYWLLGGDGGVFAYGGAAPYNAHPGTVATPRYFRVLAPTPTGGGYYLVTSLGDIIPEGDAANYWNAASEGHNSIETDFKHFNTAPLGGLNGLSAGGIVAAAATNTGRGIFLVSDSGAVYAYGDAVNRGPAAPTASAITVYGAGGSGGYTITTKTGAIYAWNMPNHGNLVGTSLAGPIVGIASTEGAAGYWLAGSDGGIFAFGNAQFEQALQAPPPTPTPPPAPTPAPPAAKCPTGQTGTPPHCVTPAPSSSSSGSSTPSSASSGTSAKSSASLCDTSTAQSPPYPANKRSDVCGVQTLINAVHHTGLTVDGVVGQNTNFACAAYSSLCTSIHWMTAAQVATMNQAGVNYGKSMCNLSAQGCGSSASTSAIPGVNSSTFTGSCAALAQSQRAYEACINKAVIPAVSSQPSGNVTNVNDHAWVRRY